MARCPYCGSTKLVKAGIEYMAVGKKQRYRCMNRNCLRHTTNPKR